MESTEMTRTVTRRKTCIIVIYNVDNLKMSNVQLISSRSLQTLTCTYADWAISS